MLEATEKVIARDGWGATNSGEIAKRARLTPASLNFQTFVVGRPLADASSACKQAAYRLKSKYNRASV